MPELPVAVTPVIAVLPGGAPPAAATVQRGAGSSTAGTQEDDIDFEEILARELGLATLAPIPAAPLTLAPAQTAHTSAEDPLPEDAQAAGQPGAVIPLGLPLALTPAAIILAGDAGVHARATAQDMAALELQRNWTPALPAQTLAERAAGGNSPTLAAAAEFAAYGRLLPSELPSGARVEPVGERSDPSSARALALLPGQGAAHAAIASSAAISAPVGSPAWDTGLGEQMVWMSAQKNHVAELHLNPPDLGPLQITLTVNNDQASAQFVSHHAAVREAIEAALPRLKEMLADAGITLGNATVSADSSRDQSGTGGARQGSGAVLEDASADSAGPLQRGSLQWWHRGSVDVFA